VSQKLIISEGLFTKNKNALVGHKCTMCGRIFGPFATFCYACGSHSLESLALSRRGRLYSYTVVYNPTKHLKPPYAIGWIELPEGIIITSLLKGWDEKALSVGIDMELVIEKLWDENGDEIIGYKFQPV